MNKKTLIIIFALCFIIFLVGGCTDDGGATAQTNPFIGGTTGLLLSFVPEAPPEQVFDSGDFPFDVEVRIINHGEYDIPKERTSIKIKGIKPSDFGLNENDFTKNPGEELLGRKKDGQGAILEGTTTYLTFSNFNYLGKLAGNTNYQIFADVCYNYGTTAITQLCVKENMLRDDGIVCRVNEKKTIYNSGSPVHVADFEQSARATDRITFTFRVVSRGNGNIYGRKTNCETTRANENRVWVEVNTGIPGLECAGLSEGTLTSGYVTLYGGERTVRCTQTVQTSVDYVKPISINLEYDYLETISTTLTVKPVN